jgi:hypothetical protein
VEEEETALLLVHASIELSPAALVTAALLHLDEPRAHTLLGDGSSSDKTELDSDVRGSVKFGDASSVEIKGVGSVIFTAESG